MRVRRLLCALAGFAASVHVAAQEINTASRAELEQLNGIGVTMADRILVERDKAPFRSWSDLERRVKGMRGARAQRLQAQGASVNGELLPRTDPDRRKR